MNAVIDAANEQEETAIRCERVCLYAESKSILDGISLDIPRGAVVGLVGRNGAGKSSLLRAMVGLAAPGSGSVMLLGRNALDMDDDIRARLGYVAQTPDLFDWLTVTEHLDLIGSAYPRWDQQHCLALAVKLDLPLSQKVSRLSGGDKQKLAVVLALAHRPEVLILDEPVSNLDPLTRRDFMRALFQEDTGKTTIVISSHLLSDLERVVSHLAFLREGSLQLFDTWDAILEHVRLVAPDADLPRSSAIRHSREQCIVDTRHAPSWRENGQACTLDQLFIALNS